MRSLTLHIEGMTCGHCLQAVRGVLERAPGVRVDTVSMGRAELAYDEAVTQPDQIAAMVADEGYPATTQPV